MTLAGAEIQGKHNVWVKAPTGLLGQGPYTPQISAVGGACGSNRGRNSYVFASGRAFPWIHSHGNGRPVRLRRLSARGEKVAKLAQKLGQFEPFLAVWSVFPQKINAQANLHLYGPT